MSAAARLRIFYFVYNCAVGANLPYFAAYLRGIGFSGEAIGGVLMLGPVIAPLAALGWASAADRGEPARVLRVACAWSLAAVAVLPWARTPLAVGVVIAVQALAEKAIVPLTDAVTLDWSRTTPGASYARIRLWGSLGFMAMAQALGLLLAWRGDRPGDPAVPVACVLAVAAYAVAARGLPSPPPASGRPHAREALGLLASPRFLALVISCGLHWACCAPLNLLFGVFVLEQGLPASVTGLGFAVGVLAEIGALLAYPWLERRVPRRALFALAFGGSALRWWLLSRAHAAAPVAALQLFHGLTFGVFWGASMSALGDLVPGRLRATGQALYTAVVFGGGNALGFVVSGRAYDRAGRVSALFAGAAVLELALTLAGLVALGDKLRRGAAGRSTLAGD